MEKQRGYAFDSPTDIRFLVLFTLTAARRPLTNVQIVEILRMNTAVNFFDLQEQIDALLNMGEIISYQTEQGDTVFETSEVGNMTIGFFYSQVPLSVREKIEHSLEQMRKQEKIEEQIKTQVTPATLDKYAVECTISAEGLVMFHMKLYAGERDAAFAMERCMKENAEILYKEMLTSLAKKMKEK